MRVHLIERDFEVGEKSAIAERARPSVRFSRDTFSGVRFEIADDSWLEGAILCSGQDGGGERVFAGALERGGEGDNLRFAEAGSRNDRNDARAAFGERAGFVDDERVRLF